MYCRPLLREWGLEREAQEVAKAMLMKTRAADHLETPPRRGRCDGPASATRTRTSPLVDTAGGRRVRRSRAAPVLALATLVWSLAAAAQTDPFAALRRSMVDDQIRKRGVETQSVLRAMETVPRHLFVPEPNQLDAYRDGPVPFAPGQNLSHAFVSARMIELLELDGDEKVLEIGTGSGYDAALLSRVARKVYTIEIEKPLANRAKRTLRQLGFDNVEVRIGDGWRGWPEQAPFDAILVTVSTREPPPLLYEQLAVGGKMVVAVGGLVQELQVITKTPEGPITRPVRLVNLGPMTGEADRQPPRD